MNLENYLSHPEQLDFFLRQHPYAVNDPINGLSPLLYALQTLPESKMERGIGCLLNHGCNANCCDPQQNTPLHVVIKLKINPQIQYNVALNLINNGANIDAVNSQEDTPLLLASENDDLNLLQLLLNSGATLDRPNEEGWTPLLAAINSAGTSGSPHIVETLLQHGADPTHLDNSGRNPVIIAATAEDVPPETFSILSDYNADFSHEDNNGYTPLMHVIGQENPNKAELIDTLVDCGCDVNQTTCYGCTALEIATRNEDLETISQLHECGANVEEETIFATVARRLSTDPNSRLLLDEFRETGICPEYIIIYLVKKINEFRERGDDSSEFIEFMEILVKNGIDPMVKDDDGVNPLIESVRTINPGLGLIQTCLRYGIPINDETTSGRTAFFEAVLHLSRRHPHYYKDDIFRNDNFSLLEINTTVFRILDELLDAGSDINHVDIFDRSLLMYNVAPEIVKYLIEHGIDVLQQDSFGRTAAYYWFLRKEFYRNDVLSQLKNAGLFLSDADKAELNPHDLHVYDDIEVIIQPHFDTQSTSRSLIASPKKLHETLTPKQNEKMSSSYSTTSSSRSSSDKFSPRSKTTKSPAKTTRSTPKTTSYPSKSRK